MTRITLVDPGEDAEFFGFYAQYSRAYQRSHDSASLAVEKRLNLSDREYVRRIAVTAHDDGQIVGGGVVSMPLRDNREVAQVDVFVAADHRRRGHGSAVLAELIGIAGEHGRTTVWAWPSWGVGVEDDPGRLFIERAGFELDMMDAIRELRLPARLPGVVVPTGYRLQSWRDACPDGWLDEYAELRRILVQEAPSGEVEWENEYWDARRVRQEEDDFRRSDRQLQVTVAQASSGELAGHTQLVFPGASTEVQQWDTLVRPEHRGHGLGLALKVHTMRAADDLLTGRTRVLTENAASNLHMIAVNEQMGYRQIGWAAEYVREI